ncbi:hypothetical protein HY483_02000 [Candidatus Woesearchaeota archaeon]|nr:hypothetical protein [Candidatus Woesearchaeota archaeon]
MSFNMQRIDIVLETSESVDGLGRALYTVLDSIGITFDGVGWRSGRRVVNGVQVLPIDTAEYDIFQGSKLVGKYEFERKNEKYFVTVDLSGLEKKMYDAVIKKVGEQYPQFTPAPVI